MPRNSFPLTFTSVSCAPVGRSRCTMQPASQVRAGGVGGSVGMGSSRGEGAAGLLMCRGVPSGTRRSWPTLRGNGGALSPVSRCWVVSASSMASTSSSVVVGFLIPTACRWERGRARRSRSMTTRSATCAADGFPSSSQCCANRMSSAAWARAGSRDLYSHTWKCCAAHTADRPSRARISRLTSSYWPAVTAGRLKYARWASPVKRGAKAHAQSAGSQPSMVAVFSNIWKGCAGCAHLCRQGEKNRDEKTGRWFRSSVTLHYHACILHQVVTRVKNHTTGTVQLKAPKGGFIRKPRKKKGVKGRSCLSAESALFFSLLAACPCSCSSGAAWSYAALCGGNERKVLGAVSWRLDSPVASFAVA